MSAYRVTCAECGDWSHGWSKAQAEANFRKHVEREHAVPTPPDSRTTDFEGVPGE